MNPIVDKVHGLLKNAGVPAEVVAKLTLAKNSIQQLDHQPRSIQRVAMLSQHGAKGLVQLFKGFQSSSRAIPDLLDTYGELLLTSSGQSGAEIWKHKWALADRGVADEFNGKLRSGSYSSYRSVVESYTGAVERLVALHLANALIHSRMAFGDAKNVDVFTWPQTEGLANGTVPYSIIPLVSAYCDPDIWRVYPLAFRHRIMGTLECGRADVRKEFIGVIDAVGDTV